VKPDAGKAAWGHEGRSATCPQDVRPIIPNDTTCFDYLHDIDPSAGNEQIAASSGACSSRRRGQEATKALSGGEAVRVLFCKLMLVQPNILGLDEPTSHLDLESISGSRKACRNYPGTVLFVAHDRDLISSSASRIFAFTHGQLEDFPGDYEAFLTKHGGLRDRTELHAQGMDSAAGRRPGARVAPCRGGLPRRRRGAAHARRDECLDRTDAVSRKPILHQCSRSSSSFSASRTIANSFARATGCCCHEARRCPVCGGFALSAFSFFTFMARILMPANSSGASVRFTPWEVLFPVSLNTTMTR